MIYDADHYTIGYSATYYRICNRISIIGILWLYLFTGVFTRQLQQHVEDVQPLSNPLLHGPKGKEHPGIPFFGTPSFSGRGWSCYRMVKSSNLGYSGVSRYCTCNAHLHNIWSGYSKVWVFYTKIAWKRLSQNSPQPGEYHRGRRHPRSGGVWRFLAETPRSGWLSQVSFCLVELMFLIDFEFFLKQLNQQKWGSINQPEWAYQKTGLLFGIFTRVAGWWYRSWNMMKCCLLG